MPDLDDKGDMLNQSNTRPILLLLQLLKRPCSVASYPLVS